MHNGAIPLCASPVSLILLSKMIGEPSRDHTLHHFVFDVAAKVLKSGRTAKQFTRFLFIIVTTADLSPAAMILLSRNDWNPEVLHRLYSTKPSAKTSLKEDREYGWVD